MQNLDKKTRLIAKIARVQGGDPHDCALQRLARVNCASITQARAWYYQLAESQENLTRIQVWSVALGWDTACGILSDSWRVALERGRDMGIVPDPDWVAVGRAAALACGVAGPEAVVTLPAQVNIRHVDWEEIVRSRAATANLRGPKAVISNFDLSDTGKVPEPA